MPLPRANTLAVQDGLAFSDTSIPTVLNLGDFEGAGAFIGSSLPFFLLAGPLHTLKRVAEPSTLVLALAASLGLVVRRRACTSVAPSSNAVQDAVDCRRARASRSTTLTARLVHDSPCFISRVTLLTVTVLLLFGPQPLKAQCDFSNSSIPGSLIITAGENVCFDRSNSVGGQFLVEFNGAASVLGLGFGANDRPATLAVGNGATNEGTLTLSSDTRAQFGGNSTLTVNNGTFVNGTIANTGAVFRTSLGNPSFSGQRFLDANLDNFGLVDIQHLTTFTRAGSRCTTTTATTA